MTQITIARALDQQADHRDVISACLTAGGVRPNEIPQTLMAKYRLLSANPSARLALHAMANVHHEATPRIEATAAWANYREDPDGQRYSLDTWCTILADLMTSDEMDDWAATADRHLKVARDMQEQAIPTLANTHLNQERTTIMAVAEAVNRYHDQFDAAPGGDFPLTIQQAVKQHRRQPSFPAPYELGPLPF